MKDDYILNYIKARCDCEDGCWVWKKSLTPTGQPQMKHPNEKRTVTVRRIAYEASGKKLQPRNPVRATCIEPLCVNPRHLKQMTMQEQCKQVAAKGGWKGAARIAKMANTKRKTQGKLSMEKAQEIRASDESIDVLAERYGVNRSLILRVRRGIGWQEFNSPFAGLLAMNSTFRKTA